MLRFPPQHDFDLPPRQRKQGYIGGPYIVFHDSQWHYYRNRWKATWDLKFRFKSHSYPYARTFSISAPTIRELQQKLTKHRR